MNRGIGIAIAGLVLWATVGCADSPGLETPPEVEEGEYIRAIYQLDEGVVPTPTGLLYDTEAGRLNLPVEEGATVAQAGFVDYLNQLDGYPLSTPIRVPMSAAIDEGSLNRSVYMMSAQGGDEIDVELTYDEDHQAISVQPKQELEPGHRYVVGVEGYDYGVRGEDGRSVIADEAFFLIRAEASLRDHPDAMPGDSAEERQERAEALAEIQDDLEGGFDLMASRGLDRDEMAVLFEFRTTTEPAIRFDPGQGAVPMPNDLLRDDDGVDLPIEASMSEEEQAIRQNLSGSDGFSISGAATVESTHDIGPRAEGLKLLERGEEGQWQLKQEVEVGRLDRGDTMWLKPQLSLEPEEDYVLVVTEAMETESGRAHRAQPLGALLTMDAALVEGGASAVSVLSDDEAMRLEPLREQVVEALDEAGPWSDAVITAVPFRTASSATSVLERRQKLYDQQVSTEVTNIESTWPSGGAGLLLLGVESVIRGEMTVLDHLDPTTREFYPDGQAVERQAKFVLSLPEDVSVAEPIPVVLFGHGLMTSRELLYLVASEFGREGYAALSVDLPYHGGRAVCIRDEGCESGASCDTDEGVCRHDDGSEAGLNELDVTFMAPFLAGTQYEDLLSYPMDSGEVFIDMDSIPGTRDHFAQALLDLQQAVRVIQGEELGEAVVQESGLWLGDEIVYMGMSLGGILGSALTATEPAIEDFVLNVPAADLTTLIEHSLVFEPLFEDALDARGIEEGSDAYFQFMNTARWVLDPVDPLNMVQHTVEAPLDYGAMDVDNMLDDRQVRVMIQQAEGDRVVPNIGTQRLSERMGVDFVNYQPGITDHAFLFDPTNTSAATRDAREDMMDFFEARTPRQ